MISLQIEHAMGPQATAPPVSGFLPHGYCFLWDRQLLVTHVVSDLLIGLAYVTISVALAVLVHRARKDIPFSAVLVAFGLFIITCGLTHFMEIWTLWRPDYWLSGGVKAVTAMASVATAVAMPFTVPKVLVTIRDARLSRERELAAARTGALEEQNALLQKQARDLEAQRAEATTLAAALERSNQQLLAAVAEAETARATAEEANRVKGEFLAAMSHELRTPLNAIGGYAELLVLGLRGPVTEAQLTDLGKIQRSQQHLLGLISGILDHAHIESGYVQFEANPVPLGALAEDVVVLVAPQARMNGLVLSVDPCGPDLVAQADEERVRQIVLNLLSNAIKFTAADGSVRVSCGADEDSVRIQVTDTGPGIAPGQAEQIFEPFVQLDRTLSRPQEGTGLGLAISRNLARGMGGELRVESRLGIGSTFTLTLPKATRTGDVPL